VDATEADGRLLLCDVDTEDVDEVHGMDGIVGGGKGGGNKGVVLDFDVKVVVREELVRAGQD
jgi:hypothetical protein